MPSSAAPALSALVDRLANRLGPDRVGYFAPVALHLPERQVRFISALESGGAPPDWSLWPLPRTPLPLRLLPAPETASAIAPGISPHAPPRLLSWRGRTFGLAALAGPDRRLGAWWQNETIGRDYWTVEDDTGRRLWLCRDLATGRWAVHGLMAPIAMLA